MPSEFGEVASRRELVALVTGLGLAALGGCGSEDGGSGGEDAGTAREGLTGKGTTVSFADTIAELRQLPGGNVGWLAVLLGNTTRGDGGGGTFYWDSLAEADDGGTKLNSGGKGSSSAGWRRLGKRSSGSSRAFVNVRDFGAGGTATDDTASILLAVDALASGGTLYFPPGVYGINNAAVGIAITGKVGLHIVGEGATLIRMGAGTRLMSISSCVDVRVSGFAFNLNGVTGYGGVVLEACLNASIEGCWFYDGAFVAGVTDHYAAVAQRSTNVRFSRNWVDKSKVEFNANTRVQVIDNVIVESEGSQAIALIALSPASPPENSTQTFSDYVIARNVIVDAEGDAIGVGVEASAGGTKTFTRIAVHDNLIVRINRAGEGGVVVHSASAGANVVLDTIQIRGNVIHYAPGLTPSRPAIHMIVPHSGQAFRGLSVSDNQVVGFAHPTLYAMSFQFLVKCSIRNNRIVSSGLSGTEPRFGIEVLNASETEIVGNVVNSIQSQGTAYRVVASGANSLIEGNRIIGSPSVPYDVSVGLGDSVETVTWRRSVRQFLPAVLVQASNWEEIVISVLGATPGDNVVAHPDGFPGQAVVWSAYVYVPGEVRVRFVNPFGTAVTTIARHWRICLERWA
jgi:hypothetical protein